MGTPLHFIGVVVHSEKWIMKFLGPVPCKIVNVGRRMARNEKEARSLVDYLLKHRYLVISRVAAGSGVKPAANLEKAEKRFLTAFITNTLASVLIILSRVWGITSPGQLPGLGLGDLITLGLAIASLVTLLLAWAAYFDVGLALSVERAVTIQPKE